jgi:CCR4-NOT complex subunit CAF16
MPCKNSQRESEENGVTLVYATHIFDGLDDWGTHIAYMYNGELKNFCKTEECAEFVRRRKAGEPSPLLRTVEGWLRADRHGLPPADARDDVDGGVVSVGSGVDRSAYSVKDGNGWLPGRFNSGYN